VPGNPVPLGSLSTQRRASAASSEAAGCTSVPSAGSANRFTIDVIVKIVEDREVDVVVELPCQELPGADQSPEVGRRQDGRMSGRGRPIDIAQMVVDHRVSKIGVHQNRLKEDL